MCSRWPKDQAVGYHGQGRRRYLDAEWRAVNYSQRLRQATKHPRPARAVTSAYSVAVSQNSGPDQCYITSCKQAKDAIGGRKHVTVPEGRVEMGRNNSVSVSSNTPLVNASP